MRRTLHELKGHHASTAQRNDDFRVGRVFFRVAWRHRTTAHAPARARRDGRHTSLSFR